MVTRVTFHRLKQFREDAFVLHPGVSLLGGGNNAGKSTILHGLAIWEFCRTAIEMERGTEMFLSDWSGQGIGLGDDEFSPINVPSLKHLWTNLRTQKESEADGYTLKIGCEWERDGDGPPPGVRDEPRERPAVREADRARTSPTTTGSRAWRTYRRSPG